MPGMITWANSITASRLVFFALCMEELAAVRPMNAIIFFLIAWGLDAIDGPIARYFHQESVLGSQLDKTIDRIILLGAGVFLVRYHYIPPIALFLFTKDIGLAMALSAKKQGITFPSAAWKGKIASVLQGIGIIWLFFGLPFQQSVVAIVAVFGGYVAVDYLRRL